MNTAGIDAPCSKLSPSGSAKTWWRGTTTADA